MTEKRVLGTMHYNNKFSTGQQSKLEFNGFPFEEGQRDIQGFIDCIEYLRET